MTYSAPTISEAGSVRELTQQQVQALWYDGACFMYGQPSPTS